jgi:hypothetical protein
VFSCLLIWTDLNLHDNFDISYYLFRKLFRVFLALFMYGRSQGVVVSIITRLQNGQSNLISIFGRTDLRSTQSSIQSVAEPLSLGIKS